MVYSRVEICVSLAFRAPPDLKLFQFSVADLRGEASSKNIMIKQYIAERVMNKIGDIKPDGASGCEHRFRRPEGHHGFRGAD